MHTMDIPFVFDNVDIASSEIGTGPERQPLADKMSRAYVAFARTSNPNHPGIPNWLAFNTKDRPTMVWNNDCKVVNDPYGAEKAAIREARANGRVVLAETRPIYLYLTEERFLEPLGERYVGYPPLRSAEHRDAIWEALSDGTVDVVATDHCSWTLGHKLSASRFTRVMPGIVSAALTRCTSGSSISLDQTRLASMRGRAFKISK